MSILRLHDTVSYNPATHQIINNNINVKYLTISIIVALSFRDNFWYIIVSTIAIAVYLPTSGYKDIYVSENILH